MRFWKTSSKELRWKIFTEEVDGETGEDLPEKETFDDSLFEGDPSGIEFLKKLYREARFLKFRYGGVGGAVQLTVFLSLMLLPMFFMMFVFLPLNGGKWFHYLPFLVAVAFLSGVLFFAWRDALGSYYVGYFFKNKNRTVTIYLPKGGRDRGMIVYFNRKSIYQLQSGAFRNIAETTERGFLGSRLLFEKTYGNIVRFKRRRGKIRLISKDGGRTTWVTVGRGNKIEINTTQWYARITKSVLIEAYNVSSDVLELPESFRGLCEKVGAAPPDDPHIRYIG